MDSMATKSTEPNFATNLRRLLLFEHHTGKDAAGAIGVDVATVSRWLTGKRYPSAVALIAIERLYGVSPRELDDDPVAFAQRLADPDRMKYAAAMREKASQGEVTAEDAARLSAKMERERKAAADRLKVVAIRPRGARKK
jgi:transcriptional regulator with XRE-family HTH domain